MLGHFVVDSLAHREVGFRNLVSGVLRHRIQKVVKIATLILLVVWPVPHASDCLAANLGDVTLVGETLQDVDALLLANLARSHKSERIVIVSQVVKPVQSRLDGLGDIARIEPVGVLAGNAVRLVESSHPVGANQAKTTAHRFDAMPKVEGIIQIQTEPHSVPDFRDFHLGIFELKASLVARPAAHNVVFHLGGLKTKLGQYVLHGVNNVAIINYVIIFRYAHLQDLPIILAAIHKLSFDCFPVLVEYGNLFNGIIPVGVNCVY